MILRFFIVIDADKENFSAIVLKRPVILFFLDLAEDSLSVMTPFIISSKINIGK
ncbi:hypothetical protein [uncultured Megasphaera sp.]|uniref:hypothetical protein n=1 Tax=Megasphaera sp. TaxID=2023260 RepID=UPI002639D031|nr:hypothetical protein [uncultured Megasphaera sp.]